jgi:hypothetical protein
LKITTTFSRTWETTKPKHTEENESDVSYNTISSSPAIEGIRLTYLSGNTTDYARILCFNWSTDIAEERLQNEH